MGVFTHQRPEVIGEAVALAQQGGISMGSAHVEPRAYLASWNLSDEIQVKSVYLRDPIEDLAADARALLAVLEAG